ncbi:glutamate 5-kinase [Ensifer sp. IC3342]|nr:glutamate 5-kinase [Ensifer sp. BRP08]MCA1451088.1 glutamate 5-kinase [Ensifer sp. IC3342]
MPATASTGQLSSARRLVVKIGSGLIANTETGEIRESWLNTLIEDVGRLFSRGQQVIIVTSGAVAVGSRRASLLDGAKHVAAAIGQVQIMRAYEKSLARCGLGVGQVLLSCEDIHNQNRRLNTKQTLQQLLQVEAVPVVNENDTTATADIRVGDNDRLAAWVAQMVGADILILLSNVDGLFTEDPSGNPLARLLTEVRFITPEIEAMASHSPNRHSSGGMITKLVAAKIAMEAGCKMLIAKGTISHPLSAIERGGPSTCFVPFTNDRDKSEAGDS